ncbi:MAG: sulfite exporter TauE/SafE family protein [Proteobacteria bacterium]|nr:sulfite exporter TauE/SafE family protein [Pseudomonadota bacterium]
MQGFLLGLSNGLVCVAYCAPVLVPYMLGEGRGVFQNIFLTAQFLTGRLLGYLVFGVIAWGINKTVIETLGYRELIIGGAYIVLSVSLIVYSFFNIRASCAAEYINRHFYKIKVLRPSLLPVVMGLATGLNFCPPFLLAITNAVAVGSLLHSLLFFFMFFLGTSLFFIPAPIIGALRGFPVLGIIGKMAAGLIGLYYFYAGIFLIIGGIKNI